MHLLIPIGVLLILIGMGGALASCYGSSDLANLSSGSLQNPYIAPLAGLTFAIGLVCVGIGMGNWRRPIPSDIRPANPWSDQPGEHGDPPKGLV